VALQLSGATVTQFREGDQLIAVVLRTPRHEHRDVDALKSLPVGRFDGRSVTLGQVASLQPEFEDGVIWRRDRLPTIEVRGDPVGNTQPATIIDSIAPQVAAFRAQLPAGFRLEIGGPVEAAPRRYGDRRVAADRGHHFETADAQLGTTARCWWC
jgi:multidrug efflux pump